MTAEPATATPVSTTFFAAPNISSTYAAAELITAGPALRILQASNLLSTPSPSPPLQILDLASGLGIVAKLLFEHAPEAVKIGLRVTCSDFSVPMVKAAEGRVGEMGWEGVEARVVDAENADLPSNTYTHVLCNLGLDSMPHPTRAVQESHRLLRPNGLCAFTTWQTIGWLSPLAVALARLPSAPPFPHSKALDWANDEVWNDRPTLHRRFESLGFVEVETQVFGWEMQASREELDGFVGFLGGLVRMFLKKLWTEGEREMWEEELVKGFGEELRGSGEGKGKGVRFWNEVLLVTARKGKARE